MPYKRNYRTKKVQRKRVHVNPIKRYVRTNRTIKWGRIAKDVRYLKGLVNTEIKYRDEAYPSTADAYWDIQASSTVGVPDVEAGPPTTGYVHFVASYPTLGDDFNQRQGRSIKLKSIQVKGRLAINAQSLTSTTLPQGWVRVYILVDHQAQEGETPDPVPILFQTDVNGHYSTESRVNRQRNKRWGVLAVRKIYLSQGSSVMKSINIYKRLNDQIKFDGTGSSDFMDKAFHVVVLAPSIYPQVGSNDMNPRFTGQFNTRLTYVDN